jgi:hypothetical protein
MKFLFLACSAWFACAAACAATPAQMDFVKRQCETADDPWIVRTVSMLDEVDRLLPNIPPEEERYLKAESAAALRVFEEEVASSATSWPRSDQMFKALLARPLYPAFALRKELESVRSQLTRVVALDGLRAYPDNAEAEKLARAANALRDVAGFPEQVLSFTRNSNRGIDAVKAGKLVLDTYKLPSQLAQYIGCKLAKVTVQK